MKRGERLRMVGGELGEDEEVLYGTVCLRRFLRHANMSRVALNDPIALLSTCLFRVLKYASLVYSDRMVQGCLSGSEPRRDIARRGASCEAASSRCSSLKLRPTHGVGSSECK